MRRSHFVNRAPPGCIYYSMQRKGGTVMPEPVILPYDRRAAVAYAHRWAFGRNPAFYDYEALGGDCTNFASQCLYAGAGVMNFTPVYGWYYRDPNDKAPAWTGVEYFYNFLTRAQPGPGPFAAAAGLREMEPGDFVQLRFRHDVFGHTPVIVSTGSPPTLDNTLVAAHSYDADNRPLSSYSFLEIRFLHVLGVYPPETPETGEGEERPEQAPGLWADLFSV